LARAKLSVRIEQALPINPLINRAGPVNYPPRHEYARIHKTAFAGATRQRHGPTRAQPDPRTWYRHSTRITDSILANHRSQTFWNKEIPHE